MLHRLLDLCLLGSVAQDVLLVGMVLFSRWGRVGEDRPWGVAEQHGALPQNVVDVLVAVNIPDMASLTVRAKQGDRLRHRAYVAVNAAGNDTARALV